MLICEFYANPQIANVLFAIRAIGITFAYLNHDFNFSILPQYYSRSLKLNTKNENSDTDADLINIFKQMLQCCEHQH